MTTPKRDRRTEFRAYKWARSRATAMPGVIFSAHLPTRIVRTIVTDEGTRKTVSQHRRETP